MSTLGWLSAAVENTWLFLVGIVVFLSINFVLTPPSVSIPKDSGVTSSNTRSLISPANTPPWIAAPIDTHSIGSIPLSTGFPMYCSTNFCITGILVGPPTKIILFMSDLLIFASSNA